MANNPFFDTNVLIYSFFVGDPRRDAALRLLLAGGSISVQTLNEFANVAAGKMKVPWTEVTVWLETIQMLCKPAISLTIDTHLRGVRITRDTGYHFYDALMLASALEIGCDVFYSEDLRDGHTIGGLTVRNPFRQKKRPS